MFQVDLVMSPCGGNHHVDPPGSAATVSYNFICLELQHQYELMIQLQALGSLEL